MTPATLIERTSLASAPAPRVVIWPRLLLWYASLHSTWFALYACLGKGFAYAGWRPFYVGELLLVLAVPAFFVTRKSRILIVSPIGGFLLCFLAWQLLCTIPFLDLYGVDALRDGVVWAYSFFACTIAALMLRLPRSMEVVIQRYRSFAKLFILLGPTAWLATLYLQDWLPKWPGTIISIPLLKGGDYDVHLAGIFAFALQGLGTGHGWWVFVIALESILGLSGRSGVLALFVACLLSISLRPRIGRIVTIIGTGLILALLMAAFDFRLTLPGTPREVSINSLADGLRSIVAQSDRNDLEGTKTWRLAWWRQIWGYTVNGPYFWAGKGYGINLADSDGFQVGSGEELLRSPHNSHLTFLARSGVPGFALWIAVQASWAVSIFSAYIRAKKEGSRWAGIFAWLLAYWVAFMVQAGFDVSLEGPMAGIPFWTVFGIGWGSLLLVKSESGSQLHDGRIGSGKR